MLLQLPGEQLDRELWFHVQKVYQSKSIIYIWHATVISLLGHKREKHWLHTKLQLYETLYSNSLRKYHNVSVYMVINTVIITIIIIIIIIISSSSSSSSIISYSDSFMIEQTQRFTLWRTWNLIETSILKDLNTVDEHMDMVWLLSFFIWCYIMKLVITAFSLTPELVSADGP